MYVSVYIIYIFVTIIYIGVSSVRANPILVLFRVRKGREWGENMTQVQLRPLLNTEKCLVSYNNISHSLSHSLSLSRGGTWHKVLLELILH